MEEGGGKMDEVIEGRVAGILVWFGFVYLRGLGLVEGSF